MGPDGRAGRERAARRRRAAKKKACDDGTAVSQLTRRMKPGTRSVNKNAICTAWPRELLVVVEIVLVRAVVIGDLWMMKAACCSQSNGGRAFFGLELEVRDSSLGFEEEKIGADWGQIGTRYVGCIANNLYLVYMYEVH